MGGSVFPHLRDTVSALPPPAVEPGESKRSSRSRRGPPPLCVLQAIAFAGQFDDVAAVGQPVEGRPGQAFVAQHLGQFSKARFVVRITLVRS